MTTRASKAGSALRTPRAAAIAGIAFSLLLGTSLVIIRLEIPSNPSDAGVWLSDPTHRNAVIFALNLVPFAGIAFLWFIGVVRDRMGQREDRFFASVFLGSGLIFVAMLFTSTAFAGGLAATAGAAPTSQLTLSLWRFGGEVTRTIVTTYAMRMAAVFTISTATIGLRLAFMPRWLGWLGYAIAALLLVIVGSVAWAELLFPFWVLLVSVHTLMVSLRTPGEIDARDQPRETTLPAATDP
ncbi:MAG: hypothetical protein ACXWQZ_14335 [Ktedonobacterales bacterium]